MQQTNRKRAGMTLAIVLSVLSVMLVLLYSVATSSTSCLNLASKESESEQARYVAEAGLNDAYARVQLAIATNPNVLVGGIATPVAMPTVNGSYQVNVVDNHLNPSPTPQAPIGFIPGRGLYLESTGTVGKSVRQVSVILTMAESHVYKYTIFSKSGITMRGTSIFDSYDSRLPKNAPQPTASAVVGTNTSIALLTNATINGDASAVGTVTGGTVTGTTFTGIAPTIFKTIDCTYLTPNDNGSLHTDAYDPVTHAFNLKGGTVTLGSESGRAEVYYFSDFSVGANANIDIRGPVTIYTTGDVDLGGGSVVTNRGLAATNLQVYNSGPNEVKLSGGATAYYCFYGPQSNVEIVGTANLFGAVVGGTINITGNAGVSYDLALRDQTPAGAVVVFQSSGWDRH